MKEDFVIKGARLVLAGDVVDGTIVIAGDRIVAVDSGTTSVPSAHDMGGDLLIPGLVELHTDNFERHLVPRPKVRWPALSALLAHDAEVVAAGITTVFDSVGVGDADPDSLRGQDWREVMAAMQHAESESVLKAEHLLHVRCELPAPNTLELFEPFRGDPHLKLISLMDHTPGQRQWENIDQARIYYTGKKGWSDEKFESQLAEASRLQEEYAEPHRKHFVSYAQEHGIVLASHDDTRPEHVHAAHAEGVTVSEFPTTEAAARTCREHDMDIIMGAPNVVRGGSHSGNVAAIHLARLGLLDILSSDYVPASLLMAAFKLVEEAQFSIQDAVALVSDKPARAVGLADRGSIASGKRADLVQVHLIRDTNGRVQPAVRAVWRGGVRIM